MLQTSEFVRLALGAKIRNESCTLIKPSDEGIMKEINALLDMA
jgi:hypothetical protein